MKVAYTLMILKFFVAISRAEFVNWELLIKSNFCDSFHLSFEKMILLFCLLYKKTVLDNIISEKIIKGTVPVTNQISQFILPMITTFINIDEKE